MVTNKAQRAPEKPPRTLEEKLAIYERFIEAARKGGLAEKHFSEESKQRQREGARKGGLAAKHFTPESKERQIQGTIRGGQKSGRKRSRASTRTYKTTRTAALPKLPSDKYLTFRLKDFNL